MDQPAFEEKQKIPTRWTDLITTLIATMALAISSYGVNTIVKMDKAFSVRTETLSNIEDSVEQLHDEVTSNHDRIVAVESKYVPVGELAPLWRQISQIKQDVIQSSLTTSPAMTASFASLEKRLDKIENRLTQ